MFIIIVVMLVIVCALVQYIFWKTSFIIRILFPFFSENARRLSQQFLHSGSPKDIFYSIKSRTNERFSVAEAFAYRRSKSNVQRNTANISLRTREQPPAYKPDDVPAPSYSLPIFTIANADSQHGRHMNVEDKELPPTYDEAIVIGQNVNVVSRRE